MTTLDDELDKKGILFILSIVGGFIRALIPSTN